MKSLVFASAILILAVNVGGAQEQKDKGKDKINQTAKAYITSEGNLNTPVVSDDLQKNYLKISLKFANEKSQLEQTPLYKDLEAQGTALNAVVTQMRAACGDKYELQIDQDQAISCIVKKAPPAPAVKPEEKK